MLHPEQCKALVETAERQGTVFYAFVSLALETGMRIGEMANFQSADIDFKNRLARVRPKEDWNPKGRRERVVAISGNTAGLLFELRNRGPYLLAGTNRDLWKKQMRQQLKATCRQAAVPEVLPHDLRRTAATLMALAGVPVDITQKVLGHRKYQTTQQHYINIEAEKAAHLALQQVLEGASQA